MKRPLILKEKSANDTTFERVDGYDWSELTELYEGNSIDKIIDVAGASVTRRVTSYPTPLARMHFFEDSFQYVSEEKHFYKNTIFHEAVSHCLDVWEILFNYEIFKNKLSIREWNFSAIKELKNSHEIGHQILGKSLDLFLQQDKAVQLDGTIDRIYLISYEGHLIAGSSPYTGFFTLDFSKDEEGNTVTPFKIEVPGVPHLNYFSSIRSLTKRDKTFQEYLYKLIKSQDNINKYFEHFYGYIDKYVETTTTISRLEMENPLQILLEYNNIKKTIDAQQGNETIKITLPTYNTVASGNTKLTLLDKVKIRDTVEVEHEAKKSYIDAQNGIEVKYRSISIDEDCGFVIQATTDKHSNKKVLALKQRPEGNRKKYLSINWDDGISVPHYHSESWESRELPSWNIRHPYLVMSDLLEEYLIELPYNINDRAFHTCSVGDSQYLLPIKPLYFEFFTVDDLEKHLTVKISGINDNREVIASLTIPLVNDQIIKFERKYQVSDNFRTYEDIHNSKDGKGHIIDYNLGLTLFPFLKTSEKKFNDFYKIGCIDGELGVDREAELHFYEQTESAPLEENDKRLITTIRVPKDYQKRNIAGSKYYELVRNTDNVNNRGDFDYIQAKVYAAGKAESIKGLIIPKWNNNRAKAMQTNKFTFAVDFGTTNSHVAYKKEGGNPTPFSITEGKLHIERLDKEMDKQNISSTEKFDYKDKSLDDFVDRVIRKQRMEFIPSIIGDVYSFPLRTAVSQTSISQVTKGGFNLFGNTNIAFGLNRDAYSNKELSISTAYTDLKWSSDPLNQERVDVFIKELLYMMRTMVILNDGNPNLTKLYWFTPLNMAPTIYKNLSDVWTNNFAKIFHTGQKAISISESEAPYYDSIDKFNTNDVLTIDIGGMTTDILYIQAKQPIFGSSFSFAGNALYGDFPSLEAKKDNGFVRAFAEDIESNIEAAINNTKNAYKRTMYKESLTFYKSALANPMTRSEDIINFFYSDDNFRFSEILKNSHDFKIVFLLHYMGILYHSAQIIEDTDNSCPADIYFSGNGSKMFNIINAADKSILNRIATRIFSKVLNEEVKIEIHLSENPKEASCNGALKSGLAHSQKPTKDLKHIHIGENITWGDNPPTKPKEATYEEIQQARKNFNAQSSEYYKFVDLFFEIYEAEDFAYNFAIKLDTTKLKHLLKDDDDTGNFHFRGTNWQTHKGSDRKAPITETVFFYPLMGAINKVLTNLANKRKGVTSIL